MNMKNNKTNQVARARAAAFKSWILQQVKSDGSYYAEAMRAQGAEIPFWLEDMLKA